MIKLCDPSLVSNNKMLSSCMADAFGHIIKENTQPYIVNVLYL